MPVVHRYPAMKAISKLGFLPFFIGLKDIPYKFFTSAGCRMPV